MDRLREMTIRGTLIKDGKETYIVSSPGEKYFKDDVIWDGYIRHWQNKGVCARRLKERDYEEGKPMVLVWPDEGKPKKTEIALYYLERLPKYRGSFLGHVAINVNGLVFNFSYRINENEAVPEEAYLYRPALGKFGTDPFGQRNDGSNGSNPYYDNFGRLFMRSIHGLNIEVKDREVKRLSDFYHRELDVIRKCPVDPGKPNIYRDFSILNRSCTTIIRDGLRELGCKKIRGIAPRDFFIHACHYFHAPGKRKHYHTNIQRLNQLKVPESPHSAPTVLLNPINWFRIGLFSEYRACGKWY